MGSFQSADGFIAGFLSTSSPQHNNIQHANGEKLFLRTPLRAKVWDGAPRSVITLAHGDCACLQCWESNFTDRQRQGLAYRTFRKAVRPLYPVQARTCRVGIFTNSTTTQICNMSRTTSLWRQSHFAPGTISDLANQVKLAFSTWLCKLQPARYVWKRR